MPKNNSQKIPAPVPVASWADWFDKAAQAFADPRMKIAYYKNGATGKPYSHKAIEATFHSIWGKLAPSNNSRVLDIGCGVGFFTQKFLSRVKLIVGTDISPHMAASAKKLNPKGFFLVCRADKLPLKGKQFDRVLSYGVTQYLPSAQTAQTMLEEIFRIVKPKGKILIGDILEPVHAAPSMTYNRTTPKGKRWWPKDLDHNLSKLYIPQNFFIQNCQKHKAHCEIFKQNIPGRSVPTPRYDVIITIP